jgi:hypothetical protein
MKKLIVILCLLSISLVNAQAFKGKGDHKLQVGVNLQDGATGLNVTYDVGMGENISLGVSTIYAMNVLEGLDASFGDRFDIKARFNANLGSVLNIDKNFDFYPGLSFSLKNFGGHIGARYFFSDGFGIYTEALFPIAKYSNHLEPAEYLHNQFSVNLGAVFNL